MIFVFYCLMSKTKTRSLYSLYKEDLCMQMRKAPGLWCAPLPSQTTKAFPWENSELSDQEEFTPVLQWIVPLQRKSPGRHNSSYCYQKACLLASCCINRSSPNWRVAGGCISITFLRVTRFQGRHMCDCREGTGKIGDKLYKASPVCGEREVRITRMVVGKLFIQILVSLEALLPTD